VRSTHHRLVLRAAVPLLVAAALPATAVAQAPPGPPGPPPGNGADIPAPPGTQPPNVPPGTPGAIPAGATGPALLSGSAVRLDRKKRRFAIPLACQSSGRLSVQARGVRGGTFARAKYRCAGNRATATLRVKRKLMKRLLRRKTLAATAGVSEGGKGATLSFTLVTKGGVPPSRAFWTDGRLHCSQDASGLPPAYLVTPDFTTASDTPVSTRGWVAWWTPTGGWHWLGVNGENKGRWDTWMATPTGIAQFHPNGVVQPIAYSWGPIQIPTGQGIQAIGVYEIVYWVGGKPEYQWQYVNAGATGAVAAGGGTLYCTYP
jgi:hypothetical protein